MPTDLASPAVSQTAVCFNGLIKLKIAVFDKVYILFHFNIKDRKFIHSGKRLTRKKNGAEKVQRIQRTRLLKV